MEFLSQIRHNANYEIRSEEELLSAFREKDRKHVIVPLDVAFPVDVSYYLSWTEPSGSYTYLVYKRPNWDSPRGLVFRRGPPSVSMCDWCHSYGDGDQISMLTVRVNPRLTIGQLLCSELNCLEKLEVQIGTAGKNFETLAEQVCDKINRFFERTIMAPAETEEDG